MHGIHVYVCVYIYVYGCINIYKKNKTYWLVKEKIIHTLFPDQCHSVNAVFAPSEKKNPQSSYKHSPS